MEYQVTAQRKLIKVTPLIVQDCLLCKTALEKQDYFEKQDAERRIMLAERRIMLAERRITPTSRSTSTTTSTSTSTSMSDVDIVVNVDVDMDENVDVDVDVDGDVDGDVDINVDADVGVYVDALQIENHFFAKMYSEASYSTFYGLPLSSTNI